MYEPNRGKRECIECKAGGYCSSNSNIANECGGGFIPCEKGTFNNLTGQSNKSACIPCPEGEFSDQDGVVKCSPSPHRLSSERASTKCTICAELFYRRKGANETDLLRNPTEFYLERPDHVTCTRSTIIESINADVSGGTSNDTADRIIKSL